MSRTQVDFRGSSIQASSVSSGRVVSEVPISSLSTSVTYSYLTGSTNPVANAYTIAEAGSYLISGVTASTADAASFFTILHVSGKAGAYTHAGTTSGSTGLISGTFTPSVSAGALDLDRSLAAGPDSVTVSIRKL